MTQDKVLTNLITGFFGAGKTTFLQSLLEKQDPKEPWAVLLNDEGDLVIDSGILRPKAESLIIEEVPGGCICCSAGVSPWPAQCLALRGASAFGSRQTRRI